MISHSFLTSPRANRLPCAAALALLFVLCIPGCEQSTDSDPATALEQVPLFDAWIPPDRYAELLSNRWSDEEVPVDLFVDGKKFTGSVEPQGAGSRYHARWSFKLELDEGQSINGLRVSNLSVQTFDDSRQRTLVGAFAFDAAGFPVFDFHPVYLRINGQHLGLYLQIERIDEDFFRRRGLPVHELIKCSFGARFSYAGGNHLEKYFEVQIPDGGNLNDFGEFIHALDQADPDRMYEELSTRLDIENYLRYHALSSLLNHVDGFSNNLYFYRSSPDAPYRVIPWDFDKLLYAEHAVGLVGGNEIAWKLLQNDSCVAAYKRLARQVEPPFGPLRDELRHYRHRIAEAHRLDPWLGGAGILLEDETNSLEANLIQRTQFFRDSIDTLVPYTR